MPQQNASNAAEPAWPARLRASGIHLALSMLVAALAAVLVFGIWYPYPYREISGGRDLFLLLVSADVVAGPLITMVVYNRLKPRKELRRDLAFVALIQVLALSYGLWTVFLARPVHLVFEYSRFRVIHAVEVPTELLDKAPADLRTLPVFGPTLLSLRPFKDSDENLQATMMALNGLQLGARPDLWQAYAAATPEVLANAKPVTYLKTRFPAQGSAIDAAVAHTGRRADALVFVPMSGRKSFWTVFLDPVNADVLAFMPLDSF